jgi:hypothetical protein
VETSHTISSLKGLIPYEKRHCWLTQMCHPWLNHLMVYGWWCSIIGNFNILKTLAMFRFFSLPLSKMKCSGVPFSHICVWKRCSPSSSSSGSSSCIVVVAMVAMGYSLMICFHLLLFELYSKSSSNYFSLISTTNDCFE